MEVLGFFIPVSIALIWIIFEKMGYANRLADRINRARYGIHPTKGEPQTFEREPKKFKVSAPINTLENKLNRGNFAAISEAVSPTMQEEEHSGFLSSREIKRSVFRNKKFQALLRNAAEAGEDDVLHISTRTETSKRFYDTFTYDYEFRRYETYLLPDNSYVEVAGKFEYSPMMERD